MCFTVDKIDQARGYLLLNEFSAFVYCCKQCHCEFDFSPDLEEHILSEHEDNKEHIRSVIENYEILGDSQIIDIGSTNMKIEPCDDDEEINENFADLIESNAENLIETNVQAIECDFRNENEDGEEFFIAYDPDNDSNSKQITNDKVTDEVSLSEQLRDQPRKKKRMTIKRARSNSDELIIPDTKELYTKSKRSLPVASQRQKVNNGRTGKLTPEDRISTKLVKQTSPFPTKKPFPALEINGYQPRQKVTSEKRPNLELRFDGSKDHKRVWDSKRKRCKYDKCPYRSYVMCSKCNVHLCAKRRDCFGKFHKLLN